MVGVAVKLNGLPEQVVVVLAAMVTDGTELGKIVITCVLVALPLILVACKVKV